MIRNAFRDGDVWLNSGDLLRPQGWRHAVFVDRLGDTFRWKGENVATTDVEAAVAADPGVEAVTVFGVKVPGADGRAGMAAAVLTDGKEFDGASLAHTVYDRLPGYAVPLFIRVVDSLEHTATVKTKKVDLREQGFDPTSTIRSTCSTVARKATSRTTTSIPTKSRPVSGPHADIAAESEGWASGHARQSARSGQILMKKKNWPEHMALTSIFSCGAAGNRTRVLRHSLKTSPCAVRYVSTRISRSREQAEMSIPVAV